MKPNRVWYLIMNSGRARIIRELPGPHDPLPVEVTMQSPRRKLREAIGTKPTRSFAAAGGGRRSAVEPSSDPLAEDARHFIREVVRYLEEQERAGAFDKLVVIGTPDSIGYWRAEASGPLKKHVQQEFIKNVVRMSSRELNAAIRALVTGES